MEELSPLKNPVEYQEKVLGLMKKYESLIGDLYRAYAEKFPQQHDFWNTIAKEEDSHAYWIETLAAQIGGGKVYFNEDRFNVAPLEGCIDEVEILIAIAKNEKIAPLEAVASSINIENGMIDKKFFEVFEGDAPEIKKTFKMLKNATLQHGMLVKEIWESERKNKEETKQSFWQKIKGIFN